MRAPGGVRYAAQGVAASLMLAVVALARPLAAQRACRNPHEAQPERPTVATHAGTVAPGWVEIEGGVEDDRLGPGKHRLGAPLNLKVGIAPRVQLNLIDTWLLHATDGTPAPDVGDLTAAVKWRIVDGLPVLGDFAILPSITLPSGSVARGTGLGTTSGSLLLISSHDAHGAAIDINAGFTRRGGSDAIAPHTSTLWTVSSGIPVHGMLSWAAEIYGYPGTSGPAGSAPIVAFLTGPTIEPLAWLEFDVGIITPISGPQARAAYAGFVWNVGRLAGNARCEF